MKIILILFVFLLSGCEQANEKSLEIPKRSLSERSGVVFTPLPENIFQAPRITEIPLPVVKDIDAIWGATGRDDNGNIYIGTSSHDGDYGSAYLYQYNPTTEKLIPQSDVVTQLKRNNVYRSGMRQNKLHSKFYHADDGYLYFSSFDEGGESEEVNPTWGGNLWRKKPNEKNWEHILATEEALVAINTNGRYIYALGYWNHVLYQYDTKTSEVNRIVVGSVKEHVSRNFLVDEVGHAYVPQLTLNDFNEIKVSLAEYDTNLQNVANHPMPSYKSENFKVHHGIVAYTSMKNGDLYFTSAEGGLYQISPYALTEKKVNYRGMMHPNGEAYIASLFPIDGKSLLVGLGREKNGNKDNQYDWISYETTLGSGLSKSIAIPVDKPLLYGTLTKSNLGDMYVVGWQHTKTNGYQPVLLGFSY